MRYPAAGVPWGRFLQHLVDLLKGETFSLRDQEIGVYKTGGAKSAPKEEDLRPEVAFVRTDKVGSNDGDDLLKLAF